jgi:hypothetical protein
MIILTSGTNQPQPELNSPSKAAYLKLQAQKGIHCEETFTQKMNQVVGHKIQKPQ